MIPHRYAIPVYLIVICVVCLLAEWLSLRMHPKQDVPTMLAADAAPALPDKMPAFQLVDQDGHLVKDADLAGQVWIANFVFTECDETCPILNQHIVEMENLASLKEVKFVSFSIGLNDGPSVLKHYINLRCQKADQTRWKMLAADQHYCPAMLVKMGLASNEGEVLNGLIAITPSFYLVDQKGHICREYDGTDDSQVMHLQMDAAAIASGGQLPVAEMSTSGAGK
jgi:protein SCO1/2